MPNGTKRARDVPLAEKMKAGEAWKDAVIRAVKEEGLFCHLLLR